MAAAARAWSAIAHADAEHTIGPERRARGLGRVTLSDVGAVGACGHGHLDAVVHDAEDAAIAAGGRDLARERQQRAVVELGGTQLDRRRAPFDRGGRDLPVPEAGHQGRRGHDVHPQPVGVESRSHRSLRRHYPDQVLRVAGASCRPLSPDARAPRWCGGSIGPTARATTPRPARGANFFQSLDFVDRVTSVTIWRTPIASSAAALHQGAPEAGQKASATNGASFVAIAPLACIQARLSGSARR